MTAAPTAASYAIAVPPGWVHVPAGSPAQMLSAVRRRVGNRPDAGWEQAAGARFAQLADTDRDHRILDSYLPMGPLPGTEVSASVAVATAEITVEPDADPDDLLLARVAAEGATVLDLGGSIAVRWSLDGDDLADSGDPSVRLLERTMVLARVPGHDDFLLTIVFSVVSALVSTDPELLGAESAIARALGEMFGAMLMTFRWVDASSTVLPHDRTTNGSVA